MSTATPTPAPAPASDLANVARLKILAPQSAGDVIAHVVMRLPPPVQKWAADNIIFIQLPKAGDSCSYSLAANVIPPRQFVCFAPHINDYNPNAKAGAIVSEIARAFLQGLPEHNRPVPTNAEVQKLVASWKFWQ